MNAVSACSRWRPKFTMLASSGLPAIVLRVTAVEGAPSMPNRENRSTSPRFCRRMFWMPDSAVIAAGA